MGGCRKKESHLNRSKIFAPGYSAWVALGNEKNACFVTLINRDKCLPLLASSRGLGLGKAEEHDGDNSTNRKRRTTHNTLITLRMVQVEVNSVCCQQRQETCWIADIADSNK